MNNKERHFRGLGLCRENPGIPEDDLLHHGADQVYMVPSVRLTPNERFILTGAVPLRCHFVQLTRCGLPNRVGGR